MRYKAIPIALAVIFGLAAASADGQLPAAAAKKKCKIVIKVINGHKRKIKICPKPKPKPTTSVSLTLDTSHAVSKPIAAVDGGAITTQAANGTKLTLTIPKSALLDDTTVTMTPVTSVAGLPSGVKFLGGAQFGPDGTPLLKDATLTIETSAAAPKLHAIAWQGTGKTPVTYAAARAGSQIEVKVVHFSGYGAADGEIGGSALRASLQTLYPQIKQKLDAATTNDDPGVVHDAIADWLGFERSVELLGDESFLQAERQGLAQLLPKITRNGIEKAYERCKNQHDVGKELRKLFGFANEAELMASGTVFGHQLTGEAAQIARQLPQLVKDRAQKCGTFQLDFETKLSVSTTTTRGNETETTTWSQHVRVLALPLQLLGDETGIPPTAGAPLEVLSYSYSDHTHSTGVTGTEITSDASASRATPSEGFVAYRLQVTPDDPPHILLELSPGTTQAQYTAQRTTCIPNSGCESDTTTYTHDTGFKTVFFTLHAQEAGQQGLLIKDWSYLGGSVYARKTYSQTLPIDGGSITETTTLDLKHTPE